MLITTLESSSKRLESLLSKRTKRIAQSVLFFIRNDRVSEKYDVSNDVKVRVATTKNTAAFSIENFRTSINLGGRIERHTGTLAVATLL